MANVKHFQVDILPASPEANSYYNLRLGANRYRQYITDANGDYIQQSDFFVDETITLTADRELLDTDNLKLLSNQGAADLTISIPTGLPTNFMVFAENSGTGTIAIAAASGVSLKGDETGFIEANSYLIEASPGAVYLRHLGSNKFIIIGNIA